MFIGVLLVRRRTSAAAPQSNCHGLYQNIDVENASCWVVLRAGNSGSWSTVETGPMILPQQPRPARRPDFHRRIPLLRSPFGFFRRRSEIAISTARQETREKFRLVRKAFNPLPIVTFKSLNRAKS
jgi:hypothetical protein